MTTARPTTAATRAIGRAIPRTVTALAAVPVTLATVQEKVALPFLALATAEPIAPDSDFQFPANPLLSPPGKDNKSNVSVKTKQMLGFN